MDQPDWVEVARRMQATIDYLSDQLAAKKRELYGQALLFQDAVNDNEALRARIVELKRGYVIPRDHAGHNGVLESLKHREDQIRKYEDLVDGLRKELAEAKAAQDKERAGHSKLIDDWLQRGAALEAANAEKERLFAAGEVWHRKANDKMAKLEDAYAKITELEAVNLSFQTETAMANARAECAEEQLHYANGVADLATKHRDSAEAECKTLREALKKIENKLDWVHDQSLEGIIRDIARNALNLSPAK